jgi:hypothetical protein
MCMSVLALSLVLNVERLCPIIDFRVSIVILIRILVYTFSFYFSWDPDFIDVIHRHRPHACGVLNFCLNSHRWFMLYLVYIYYLVLYLVPVDTF